MSWGLNDIEAAQLEQRVLDQLRDAARKIIAADSTMTDRALLLRLNYLGYSCEELVRINDTIKVRR